MAASGRERQFAPRHFHRRFPGRCGCRAIRQQRQCLPLFECGIDFLRVVLHEFDVPTRATSWRTGHRLGRRQERKIQNQPLLSVVLSSPVEFHVPTLCKLRSSREHRFGAAVAHGGKAVQAKDNRLKIRTRRRAESARVWGGTPFSWPGVWRHRRCVAAGFSDRFRVISGQHEE